MFRTLSVKLNMISTKFTVTTGTFFHLQLSSKMRKKKFPTDFMIDNEEQIILIVL